MNSKAIDYQSIESVRPKFFRLISGGSDQYEVSDDKKNWDPVQKRRHKAISHNRQGIIKVAAEFIADGCCTVEWLLDDDSHNKKLFVSNFCERLQSKIKWPVKKNSTLNDVSHFGDLKPRLIGHLRDSEKEIRDLAMQISLSKLAETPAELSSPVTKKSKVSTKKLRKKTHELSQELD